MKSARNKTIDFSITDGKEYLNNCVKESEVDSIPLNKIVIGNTFLAIEKIKDKSVDLLIVDPPYNLDKSFHGNNFRKTDEKAYTEYTESYLNAVKPKLKDTASIYVCCDYKSGIIIGKVISDNFILRNRITWEREKGRGAKANWKNSMEDVYFATVGEKYTFNLIFTLFVIISVCN